MKGEKCSTLTLLHYFQNDEFKVYNIRGTFFCASLNYWLHT